MGELGLLGGCGKWTHGSSAEGEVGMVGKRKYLSRMPSSGEVGVKYYALYCRFNTTSHINCKDYM